MPRLAESPSQKPSRPRSYPLRPCVGYGSRDSTERRRRPPRTAIAALGMAAIAYQYENDFDLRSRCLLLPTHPPRLELLGRDGSASEVVDVDRTAANAILSAAAGHAQTDGIGWETGDVRLTPAPKLIELIRRSRKAAATEPSTE